MAETTAATMRSAAVLVTDVSAAIRARQLGPGHPLFPPGLRSYRVKRRESRLSVPGRSTRRNRWSGRWSGRSRGRTGLVKTVSASAYTGGCGGEAGRDGVAGRSSRVACAQEAASERRTPARARGSAGALNVATAASP